MVDIVHLSLKADLCDEEASCLQYKETGEPRNVG